MPSQDIGSVPHEVGQLRDVWAKVRRDALSLADTISLLPPGGQSSACSARDFRREFSHALPVRAVGGQRERERDTAGGGGVATRLQRQSVIVQYCG